MAEGYDRLRGRTALVTGATRGLGRVIAEWLALDGANLVVTGRGEEAVRTAVKELSAFGTKVTGIPADLAQLSQIRHLIDTTLAQHPELDIVVNNAGMSVPQVFWECTDEDFEAQITANLRAPFVINQTVARHWIDRNVPGRIVNISTVGVFTAHTDRMVYNMSKAGVQAMTKNMSYELGPYGIIVNCIAPGNVFDRPGQPEATPEAREEMNSHVPLGRVGKAEDIASAVRYFCLPESAWTTGQTLLIDGGMVSAMGFRGRAVPGGKDDQ